MALVKLAIVDNDDGMALIDISEVDDLMDQLSAYASPIEMVDDDEDADEDDDEAE